VVIGAYVEYIFGYTIVGEFTSRKLITDVNYTYLTSVAKVYQM